MERKRVLGAIRFPAFLLFWSTGVVLVAGQFDSAEATYLPTTIATSASLTQPVRLDDREALTKAFDGALKRSEVFSGQWEPMDDLEKTVTDPMPATETSEVQLVDSGSPARELSSAVADVPLTVVPKKRTVHMSSDPAAADGTVGPKLAANDNGFRKTTAESGVRKTRPGVNLALVSLKQDARRKIGQGQLLQAFSILRASVDRGRNDPEYLGLLAVSALRSGNVAEAGVVYERLVEMQPEAERWWAGLALSREQQGMDATPVFQRLLALSDENSALKRLVRQKIGAFG